MNWQPEPEAGCLLDTSTGHTTEKHTRMKKKLHLRYRLAILFLAATPFAAASLLLDPTGAASVGLVGSDSEVTRDLGGTFNLYGTNITSINLADDGFLGTGEVGGLFADRGIGTLADLTTLSPLDTEPIIAPFYDGLAFGQGSDIVDQSVSNMYYAVTYQSMYGFNQTTTGQSSDFQVILFMNNVTLGGFHFLAGDIAMSYGNLNSAIDGQTFSVGVAQNSSNFTSAPASIDGQLTDFTSLPTGSQFFLFRPDSGGMQVSVESTTPEPASLALFAIGLIGLAILRCRK
jgi:hypothetical protein